MLTAASLLLSFAPPQKLATDDPAAQRALFDDFKSRFSKSYATADEERVWTILSRACTEEDATVPRHAVGGASTRGEPHSLPPWRWKSKSSTY